MINLSKATRLVTWGFANVLDWRGTLLAKQGAQKRQREPFRALAGLLAIGTALCLLLGALQKIDKKEEIKPKPIITKAHEVIDYQIFALKEIRSLTQFNCLVTLWNRESNWRVNARNGKHYGIPQGESIYLKTADPYEQIAWGLRYIKARYGIDQYNKINACLALGHSYRNGFY